MEQTNEEQWDWYVSSVSLELRNAINDALKTLAQLKIDTESAALIKRAIQRIQDNYEKIKSSVHFKELPVKAPEFKIETHNYFIQNNSISYSELLIDKVETLIREQTNLLSHVCNN